MAVSHSKSAGLVVNAIAVLSAVVLPAGFLLAEQGSDGSTQNSVSDRPAVFTLHVPPGASVRFDGKDTDQTGLARRFVTAPLTPGREYTYELSVTWIDGGRAVERKRRVVFWAGEHLAFDFGPPTQVTVGSDLYQDPAAPKPWGTSYYENPLNAPDYIPQASRQRSPETASSTHAEIRVRVPADAEILFDGAATTQMGTQRLFVTPPLNVGKKYHYEVVAVWKQGDKPIRKVRRVEVSSGAKVVLDFLTPPLSKADKE